MSIKQTLCQNALGKIEKTKAELGRDKYSFFKALGDIVCI